MTENKKEMWTINIETAASRVASEYGSAVVNSVFTRYDATGLHNLASNGNMDTCIAIRLAYKKHGRICVQSGAGIVADSVPEKEFIECCNKAKAVVNAIQTAEGGLL